MVQTLFKGTNCIYDFESCCTCVCIYYAKHISFLSISFSTFYVNKHFIYSYYILVLSNYMLLRIIPVLIISGCWSIQIIPLYVILSTLVYRTHLQQQIQNNTRNPKLTTKTAVNTHNSQSVNKLILDNKSKLQWTDTKKTSPIIMHTSLCSLR